VTEDDQLALPGCLGSFLAGTALVVWCFHIGALFGVPVAILVYAGAVYTIVRSSELSSYTNPAHERQNAAAHTWMYDKDMPWAEREPAYEHVLLSLWNTRRGSDVTFATLRKDVMMHPDLLHEALRYWKGRQCLTFDDSETATLVDSQKVSLTENGRTYCLRRGEARVTSMDKELDDILNSRRAGKQVIFNISGGTIGQVAVADTLLNLQHHILAITDQGELEVAAALKSLGQAVLDEPTLDDRRRADLVDNVDDIANAAETPHGQRKHGRLQAAINSISAAAAAGTKLHQAWVAWGPYLEQLLHH
jgi:hypothetical protein